MDVIVSPRESRFGRKLVPLVVIYHVPDDTVGRRERDYSCSSVVISDAVEIEAPLTVVSLSSEAHGGRAPLNQLGTLRQKMDTSPITSMFSYHSRDGGFANISNVKGRR